MTVESGRIHGQQHGFEDGVGGNPRNPRPEPALLRNIPGYLTDYMAAYEIAYNRNFRERELIIRRAAINDARRNEGKQSIEWQERQAEDGREI